MHYLLAGTQIRLTYLQDRRALAAIDWPSIFDDMADVGAPPGNGRWCDLSGLTHVVLASDRASCRYVGVLGLTEQRVSREPWLLIDHVMIGPAESGGLLPYAMLAHALARIVCLDGKPIAVAASRTNREVLSGLSLSIRSAALHPPAKGNVVALRTATLARSLGTANTVLDLRHISEASLLRDLRGLHGMRPDRLRSLSALRQPMAKSARSGGATPRPRKATRTDMTG
jgi:hypothetical protein